MSQFDEAIDLEALMEVMKVNPSLTDAAAIFSVSENDLERILKNEHGISFVQLRDRQMALCRYELVRTATNMALKGDRAMLALCLKHVCEWNDKANANDDEPIRLAYDPNGLPRPSWAQSP